MTRVPFYIGKNERFASFFPGDTVELHKAPRWGLYYSAFDNASYFVIDVDKGWRIIHYPGRMQIAPAQQFMNAKMQQLEATGCCGEEA